MAGTVDGASPDLFEEGRTASQTKGPFAQSLDECSDVEELCVPPRQTVAKRKAVLQFVVVRD
jgi:hypothetical protein